MIQAKSQAAAAYLPQYLNFFTQIVKHLASNECDIPIEEERGFIKDALTSRLLFMSFQGASIEADKPPQKEVNWLLAQFAKFNRVVHPLFLGLLCCKDEDVNKSCLRLLAKDCHKVKTLDISGNHPLSLKL
jgi:hypothetical protein